MLLAEPQDNTADVTLYIITDRYTLSTQTILHLFNLISVSRSRLCVYLVPINVKI